MNNIDVSREMSSSSDRESRVSDTTFVALVVKKGSRPLTHDHEKPGYAAHTDIASADISHKPPSPPLRFPPGAMPAMPIDETVCRGSRRRLHRGRPFAPPTRRNPGIARRR